METAHKTIGKYSYNQDGRIAFYLDEVTITCLNPSRWQLLKARLFGEKVGDWSEDGKIDGYYYKGVTYKIHDKLTEGSEEEYIAGHKAFNKSD